MFYNYILDHSKNGLYTSIKPTHHIQKYYQELRQLNLDDIITLYTPSKKKYLDDNKKFIFTPSVWKIVDIDALKLKAETEVVKPYFRFQKGKLISYLNRFNAMPWTNQWIRMKFDKGRCNGEMAWKTTENEKHCNKDIKDRFALNDLIFGDNNWIHYDVPSSIPQIIYLINNKKWFGKRVWDITGEKVKSLGQRIMFNTTEYALARSMFQYYKGNNKCSPSKTKYWGEWQNGVWVESEYTEYQTFLEDAKYVTKRLTDVIGPLPGNTKEERNQLFIHESNIYLMVLGKFLDAGAKVYQVYDSFYWNKDSGVTSEMVAEWCKECGEYYITHYDEIMAKEEMIFDESTIQQKLEKKEKANKRGKRNMKVSEMTEEQHQKALARDRSATMTEQRRQQQMNKPSARMKHVRVWVIRNGNKTDYPKKWSKEEIEYAKRLQSKK